MDSQSNPFRVLFLCRGNTCRSQMAESLLGALGDTRFEIHSAGFEVTESQVAHEAVQVLGEIGIKVQGQRPKRVADIGPVPFDLVFVLLEKGEKDDLADLGILGIPFFLHWPTRDPRVSDVPGDQKLAEYRSVRDKISEQLKLFLSQGTLEAMIVRRDQTNALVDTLDDGIIVHDADRRIFLFNQAAERITGYRREEVLGKDCHLVFQSGDGICGGKCSFCSGTPSELLEKQEYEIRFSSRDGEDRRLKMMVSPARLGHGTTPGVIAVIRNVTEFKALKEKLEQKYCFHGMVAQSRQMAEIFQIVRETSLSNYPVLITGESGTGKELTALAIHNESSRKGGPFVPINCGALPEQILESELFGHVRGAFTGAIREKKGRFELAHGGTIFLDEIGEISPSFQVKLLRVLQEKRFEKVGGEKTVSVDVRVIAATNQNLKDRVEKGSFREDLYYRLCVIPIHLPALRDRKEDLSLLVEQILKEISEESGKPVSRLSDSAMDIIHSHDWPGNIRQLKNVLQYASVRAIDGKIDRAHLPPELRTGFRQSGKVASGAERGRLSREKVLEALEKTGGNKFKSAKMLGIGRATLYRFLSKNQV